MSNDSKYTLGPIYIVNFFGTLGFSIVFPFLVFLNLEFGGDSFVFGMLIAVYSIFQIPGAVILGRLSDKIGRKKVLLASHIGTSLLMGGVYFCAASSSHYSYGTSGRTKCIGLQYLRF